jgi:hypothetical protein
VQYFVDKFVSDLAGFVCLSIYGLSLPLWHFQILGEWYQIDADQFELFNWKLSTISRDIKIRYWQQIHDDNSIPFGEMNLVPYENNFFCLKKKYDRWRLFWTYLMKVILNVPDDGYSERTWWRLFQKHVVCTKLDMYVSITLHNILIQDEIL